MAAECSVAGEIYGTVLRLNDVPAPQSFVLVEDSPAGKMQCRNTMNSRFIELLRFAPIELISRPYLFGPEQSGYAYGNNECDASPPRQPAQGRKVQMIVVVVADQHDVDLRKILLPDSGVSSAARPYPGKWARALRPDWIGQNVGAPLLEQHR